MRRLHLPALPLCGGCPCAAVRFAVKAMPLLVYACHCGECQRASGSSFGLSMPVAADSFALTNGKPRSWRRAGASGVESISWFCADCGGRIFGERASGPEIISVRAGTLDDTSWLRPVAHIYLRNAQAWQRIPNHAECFDVLPADFHPLSERWRQMWREPSF